MNEIVKTFVKQLTDIPQPYMVLFKAPDNQLSFHFVSFSLICEQNSLLKSNIAVTYTQLVKTFRDLISKKALLNLD
jgi:hypothetical protein